MSEQQAKQAQSYTHEKNRQIMENSLSHTQDKEREGNRLNDGWHLLLIFLLDEDDII